MQFKYIFFDCDGVLTFENHIDQLNRAVGLSEEVDRQWFDEYYSGKISFQQWMQRLDDFYREQELTKSLLETVVKDIHPTIEAKEIVQFLLDRTIDIAIISNGLPDYVQKYAQALGIKRWEASFRLLFDEAGNYLRYECDEEDPQAKVEAIQRICREKQIDPAETMFVGDSANDLGAFGLTQHGVLYRTRNEEYEKHAWKRIDNLNEIREFI